MKSQRVVVVGGGVIGVSCAYFLARRGARVTLLERDAVGRGASFGNAGTIAPGHGPINRPGRVRQALRSLLDPLGPLYVAPRPDPALARWLLTFARSCSLRAWERALAASAPLGHATVEVYERLMEEEALECGYRRAGYFEVYRTERGLSGAHAEAAHARAHGFRAEPVSGAALRDRIPALSEGVRGGVFFPDAMTVHPYRLVTELAARAEGLGARVREGTPVAAVGGERASPSGVRTASGEWVEADAVVLATGAYSAHLAADLGLRLPLQAAKGYHCDRAVGPGGMPDLADTCMLGETSVFCTPLDGVVRLAGTLEFSGENHRLRPGRLAQLTRAAERYLDGVEADETPRSEWCGLRPCLADGLPALGPVPGHPRVFVATGHAMLGLTLGPVTGRLIAEWVLDGAPSLKLDALAPGRFA